MKKILITLMASLFLLTINMTAQHRPHHRGGGLSDMKEELNLTDEQMKEIRDVQQMMREEMKSMKEEEMDREQMKEKYEELKERKKSIMAEILTPEQMEKMEEIHATRKADIENRNKARVEMREKKKETREPMFKELMAYHEQNIAPVVKEERAKLDKQMKRKDRKLVTQLRETVKTEMEKMRKEHEAKRTEKGDHAEMRKPHHHKGGHKPHPMMNKKGMMGLMKLMKDNREELETVMEIVGKYDKEITQSMNNMDEYHEKWGKEMKAIRDKYISEEDRQQWNKFQRKKKDIHKRKGKEGCKKAPGAACEKADSKTGNSKDEWKSKFDKMKKAAFLLMPTEKPQMELQKGIEPTLQTLQSKVYPNPSGNANTLEFDVEQVGNYRIELFDANGRSIKVVAKEKMDKGLQRFQVDVSDLPNGNYYYLITDGRTKSTVQFIKN